MTIYFSGDDRGAGDSVVSEEIRVDTVTSPLSLFVKAYRTGAGVVSYSWDSPDNCNFDNYGCQDCNLWAGCKDGDQPVCDGQAVPRCVDPQQEDLAVALRACNFFNFKAMGLLFAVLCF